MQFGRTERLIRINPIESIHFQNDIQAVLPLIAEGFLDGLVLPKVDGPDYIRYVGEFITRSLKNSSNIDTTGKILAIVESARGIINLKDIVQAHPRLDGLIFGAEDYSADAGITRTPSTRELLYARSAVVTYAAAFGKQAIDMVSMNFEDLETLKRESKEGAEMGFTGKQCIHPKQIETIHQAFAPTREQIERAKKIIEIHEKNQREGVGAFSFEGEAIDMPVILRAEGILTRAKLFGLL